jgi:OOP family OmpA-OmpF porin
MELSAPRPVITPFTLRFLIDGEGARFDACSADTEAARTRILAAAVAAGAQGKIDCTLGLGVPSPRWADAVAAGVSAMAELGAGSLTFSDADVSLVAADSVTQGDFDRVVGELQRALPDLFSLTAVLTPKAEADATDGPAEFTATLSAESGLQLRGPLPDGTVRTVVESFAVARFGADRVYNATRLDGDLPGGWSVRVLAALQALAELSSGSVMVQPDQVAIRGQTGSAGASAEIARLFAAELGEGAKFDIAVTYVERLDPTADLPTPEECVREINLILAAEKIVFAPGSAEIPGESISTLDAIATALKDCAEVPIEIGAHSDSQGRDEMNLRLSQERADAVLNGLMARRVLTANIRAVGYGETRPIADNGTEEGREANRRIEFTLIAQEVDGAAPTEDSAADGEDAEAAAAEGDTEDGNAQTGGAEGTE